MPKTTFTYESVASVPYTCDFENTTENGKWAFANDTYTNKWIIGTATSSSSSHAMYVSNNGSANEYTMSSASSYVYAYRKLSFATAGDYNVSFKWKARGESGCWDAMYAALVPDGTACPPSSDITGSTNSLPSGYINVGDVSQSNNTSGVFLWTYSESDWRTSSMNVNIATAGTYTLVFYWKNDGSGGNNPPAAVDDISVTAVNIPYTIASVSDWNDFCAAVNNGHNYSGETVTMTANVGTVSTMCGTSSSKPFSGTFDGGGYTLTVGITGNSTQGQAPFQYISGATIENLVVTGSVTATSGAYPHASGLVGFAWSGTNTIENCLIHTNVTNNGSNVDSHIGGIVGHAKTSTVVLTGCVYDGLLTSSKWKGGLIGWADAATVQLTNCLFNGTVSTTSNFHPIGCKDGSSAVSGSVTNCYYYATNSINSQTADDNGNSIVQSTTGKGKRAYSVTAQSPVSMNKAGSAIIYEVSQLTGYTTGIVYDANSTIYGGEGETLTLNLYNSPSNLYIADNGTLAGSNNPYTLTMEANNTVISAANPCPAPTQWYMPTWSVKGNTAKATLSWGVEAGNTEEWQLCLNDGQQDHYYDVKVDYEDPNITEVSIQDAGTTVICTLINLTANTTYTAKVRTVCDATEEVYSSWVEGIFTTTPKTFQDNGDFDGQWNNPNNWTPSGVPGVEDVVIDEEANISDGVLAKANDITIGENGSITIEDGGQLWHNNDDVELTIKKTITGYGIENASTNLGYQLFSSPVDTDAEGAGLLNGTYNLYRFDSQANDEGPLEEWVVETSSIEPFVGYLYANEENTNITITGTVMGSSQSQTKDLVYNEGYRFGGWNLMGNPFVCNAYVSAGNNEEINYYVIEESNGRAEFVPANESNPIAPMGGLMVQATGEGQSITYSRTQPNKGSGILNMSVTKVLSSKGDALLDRARVRFGNGRNLEKFQLNPNHTKIYIPEDGKDYAVVYANGAGTIPVNFKAESYGRYNISFTTEEVGFNYLHLIDNRNGNDVDLLETPYYAFDAQSTDYASRFTLVFATGHNDSDDTFAFFNNGVWIINNPSTGSGTEATLQVVDVMGRVLSSETISGSCSKAINAAPGVYMLRLINGNDVKVQKVVVR